MKPVFSRFFLIFGIAALLGTLPPLSAQNDNPTGKAGLFNGNSDTGGSYDPYTANATRTVVDLVVPGAVGAHGLQWTRTMNTRLMDGPNYNYGSAGSWQHAYNWGIDWIAAVNIRPELPGKTAPARPLSYIVDYPDGRVVEFTQRAATDTVYRGPSGVTDRFQSIVGNGFCYLLLSDGAKVQFQQYAVFDRLTAEWQFEIYPRAMIDPNGLVTNLIGFDTAGRLTQVIEPAGRWLKINYITAFGSQVIGSVEAGYLNTVTQSVTYSYQQFTAGSFTYTTLTGVSYSDGTSAAYTYQPSNTYPNTGPPLIRTCDDVRYPGAMKKIAYEFVAQPSENNGGIYGEFATARKWLWPAPFVVSYGLQSHAEQRGDGPLRFFRYGPSEMQPTARAYLLTGVTDFKGRWTEFGYDSNSYLNGIWDPKGNPTAFTRTPLTGKLLTVTHPPDAAGVRSSIHFSYADPDTAYYLQSVTDELQHTTVYQRDANKRVKEIDYPDTAKETFLYNALGQVLTHGMTSGGTETFEYDSRGRRQAYRDPYHLTGNPTFWYQYDSSDRVSGITDSRGSGPGDINYTTNFEYNQRGQLSKTTHPRDAGTGARYTLVNAYNDDGTVRDATDERGNTTSYGYDDYKRITSVTAPLAFVGDTAPRTTYFYYNRDGSASAEDRHTRPKVGNVTSPGSKTVKTVSDENFWKTSETVGTGGEAATTSYTYDLVGNVLRVTDPNGQATGAYTEFFYDPRNRLTDVNDPLFLDRNSLGHTVSWTYDQASNRKTQLRANDQLTTYDQYDPMNRLQAQSVQRDAATVDHTAMTYDLAGNLVTFVDGRQKTYTYGYDFLNRKTRVTYPADDGGAARTENYHFDSANNMDTFTNREGAVQTFQYDNRNRETGYFWDSWPQNTLHERYLSYDERGNLHIVQSSLTDLPADTTVIEYDSRNRKKSETQTNAGRPARTVGYTYDADSNRQTMTYPSGLVLNYTYTSRNQLYTIVSGITTLALYQYDLSGNTRKRQLGNGTTTLMTPDLLNRTELIRHFYAGTEFGRINYHYDKVSRVDWVRRDSFQGDRYDYYLDNQLKGAAFDAYDPANNAFGATNITSLTYDGDGNRVNQTNSTSPSHNYSVNDLNEYTAVDTSGVHHDAAGNLKDFNARDYYYNRNNQLTFVKVNGTGVYGFYYDGLNRQILRSDSQWIYSVWDGWDLLEEYDINGNVIHTYVHGRSTDELVARFDAPPFVNRIWYYQDAQGSTTHLANDNGTVVERYKYPPADAGAPSIFDGGGNPIAASAYDNRFLYTGREYYRQSGFYDYRNRTYLPSLGRFLQPDRIGFAGDPSNLYRYCGNNAVNLSDPTGLHDGWPWTYHGGFPPLPPQGQLFFSGLGNLGIGIAGGIGVVGLSGASWGTGTVFAVTTFGHAAVFTGVKGISQIVSSFAGTAQQQAGSNAMPGNLSSAAAQVVPTEVGIALQALEAIYAGVSALNAINNEGLRVGNAFDALTAAFDAYNLYQDVYGNHKDPFEKTEFTLDLGGPGSGREGGGDPIDIFYNGPGDYFRPGLSGFWFDEMRFKVLVGNEYY